MFVNPSIPTQTLEEDLNGHLKSPGWLLISLVAWRLIWWLANTEKSKYGYAWDRKFLLRVGVIQQHKLVIHFWFSRCINFCGMPTLVRRVSWKIWWKPWRITPGHWRKRWNETYINCCIYSNKSQEIIKSTRSLGGVHLGVIWDMVLFET